MVEWLERMIQTKNLLWIRLFFLTSDSHGLWFSAQILWFLNVFDSSDSLGPGNWERSRFSLPFEWSKLWIFQGPSLPTLSDPVSLCRHGESRTDFTTTWYGETRHYTRCDLMWGWDGHHSSSVQDEKSTDFGRSEFGNPQKVMGNPHEIRCFGGSGRLGDMAARQLCPVAMAPKWVCWQGWWVWPENHLLSLLLVYDISTVYMYLCIYIHICLYTYVYIYIYVCVCGTTCQDFPVDETPSHVTYSARHKVAGGSQVSVRLRLTRAEMSRSLRAKDVMEIKIRHGSPDRKSSDFHWITLNIPKFW